MTLTIVVPLDGSENAEQALPWAAALARRRNASLLLVSVIDIPLEFGTWSVSRAPAIDEEMNRWMAESEEYLRRSGESLSGVSFDVVVKLGSASIEIRSVIEALENPVVVMSSHGRTGARRILLGSVAARVIHDARCPVLVVRYLEEGQTPETPLFERVLAPLDGSEFSEHALTQALDVLGDNLSIHLLRVIELPVFRAGGALEPGMSFEYGLIAEYLDATRDESVAYLQEQSELLTARGYSVTTEVRDGRVAEEILRVAGERDAHVIAMATHGRGGIGRLVFGSVAESVLSEARAPLLLMRPHDES
ncbi:MAG TPA: universal stress protein [Thermomicrobiales bacterium]|nr:universal stress protein [Thermomicrobiales bacterium]